MFPRAEFSDREVGSVSGGTALILCTAVCQEHITHKLHWFPRSVHSGSPPWSNISSRPSGSFPHKPWTRPHRAATRVRTSNVRAEFCCWLSHDCWTDFQKRCECLCIPVSSRLNATLAVFKSQSSFQITSSHFEWSTEFNKYSKDLKWVHRTCG